MDIGTGTDEDVRVVVDGRVRLVFHPDGSVEWHCAHAHAAHNDPVDTEYSARICTRGCWHGRMVGEAELTKLELNLPTQATVGPKGNAEVTPNKPEGYLTFVINGTEYVMPYFKKQ